MELESEESKESEDELHPNFADADGKICKFFLIKLIFFF